MAVASCRACAARKCDFCTINVSNVVAPWVRQIIVGNAGHWHTTTQSLERYAIPHIHNSVLHLFIIRNLPTINDFIIYRSSPEPLRSAVFDARLHERVDPFPRENCRGVNRSCAKAPMTSFVSYIYGFLIAYGTIAPNSDQSGIHRLTDCGGQCPLRRCLTFPTIPSVRFYLIKIIFRGKQFTYISQPKPIWGSIDISPRLSFLCICQILCRIIPNCPNGRRGNRICSIFTMRSRMKFSRLIGNCYYASARFKSNSSRNFCNCRTSSVEANSAIT